MINTRYRISCGRIAGRSHSASTTPCQDYAGARRTHEMACIALADGAGSRPHSEAGAKVVVKEALGLLADRFDEIDAAADSDPTLAAQMIMDHLLAALGKKAKGLGYEVGALASTLLFAAHKANRFLAGHIGDGVIARLSHSGDAEIVSYPDNGEFANTTVFVTDPHAVRRFRLYRGDCDSQSIGFVLMSDGTAESLYEKSTGRAAAAICKLLTWNASLSKRKMKAVLDANLKQAFAKKSADDCSIALLSYCGR